MVMISYIEKEVPQKGVGYEPTGELLKGSGLWSAGSFPGGSRDEVSKWAIFPQGSKGFDGPFEGLYKGVEEFIVGL